MKIEIKNRWTREVIFSVEADSWRFAVEAAIKANADLSNADLRNADLRSADLSNADLRNADLRNADLSRANLRNADLRSADLSNADLRNADLRSADLSRANLSWADLRSADLSNADLRNADLSSADLSKADLRVIKADLWSILLFAVPEIPALKTALKEGKVDGSTYSGECACLCGTIAKTRKCDVEAMPNIKPDSSRPIERFFFAIRPGNTPENNQVAKIAMEWIEEFELAVDNIKLPANS